VKVCFSAQVNQVKDVFNIHMKKVLSQTWLVLVSAGRVYSLFVDTYHTILILFMYVNSSIVFSFRLYCLFSHSMGFLAVGEGAVKQSELHQPAH
jgi:hypothetical protein